MSSSYKSHVIIDLNSKDRDSGSIEEPRFHLSHQIKFSQSPTKSYYMRLEGTLIPKTFYDIDSTNNKLLMIEAFGGPASIDVTITPGNYTITELLTLVESQLDGETVNANAFTLTYDDTTNKVSFLVAYGGSETAVSIETIANGSTLNELLGIGKTSFGLVDAEIALADAATVEATYVVDLDTKSYISVETDLSSANYYDKNSQKHVGAIVPINVDRNEKQYFENSDGHLTRLNNKGPISSVRLHLKDEYGNTINLNGAEWSSTMAIYEHTELHKI